MSSKRITCLEIIVMFLVLNMELSLASTNQVADQNIAALETRIRSLERLTTNISDLEADVLRLKGLQKTFVAFSASLSPPYPGTTVDIGTLIFNHICYNRETSYNPQNGIFTCKIDGVYIFHHTLYVTAPDFADSVIVKNGVSQAWIQGGGGYKHDASSSASTAIDLHQGDQVWVKVISKSGGHTGGQYTSFSGYLIHA